MMNFYDIAYGVGVGVSAPYWLIKPSARRKVLAAFRQRMGRDITARAGDEATILIHAVSLGEINATRSLVQTLRQSRPGVKFVVTATTETGFARGQELYGPAEDVTVARYPLDFSGAIIRLLDAVRPDVVVLMELEVWPNFMKQCHERGIPVVLANARLTEPSFHKYRRGGWLMRRMFQRLSLVCAQDLLYGERFLQLGVPPHHIVIAGTMKFDNANLSPPSPAARERAELLGLQPGAEILWVCGSTGPGEEEILLRVYRKLLPRFPRLRLIIVPRHPERFGDVEQTIVDNRFDCVRSTRAAADLEFLGTPPIPPIVLIDAIGVLRDYYSVAEVVFVGRTLVDLGARQHGSDMIEPAALGKPVVVGPFTGNFADAMTQFRSAEALLQVSDEAALEQVIGVLLSTPKEAAAMGARAASVVKREQGATMRHARVILQIMSVKRGEGDMGLRRAAHPVPQPAARQNVWDSPRSDRMGS